MMNTVTQSLLLALTVITCAAPVHAAETATFAGEGKLDKDLIRRVVRAHIPEIRVCYNGALERDPQAQGRIVIDFTIGEQGKVTGSKVGAGDFKDAVASQCMADAIAGWLFPKPDGGSVSVSYPFVLEPG